MRIPTRTRPVFVLMALVTGLVSGLLPILAQGGEDVTVVGGDVPGLREMIATLVRAAGPGGQSTVGIGALPGSLPFDLPLPDDARVVGSITSLASPEAGAAITVLLNTTLPPEDVADFYAAALTGGDWRTAASTAEPGGFTDAVSRQAAYCFGSDTLVNIQARSLFDGTSGVRLVTNMSSGGAPCNGSSSAADPAADVTGLIPQLHTPEGAQLRAVNEGEEDGPVEHRTVANEAVLTTAMAPGDLIELYNVQLLDAGWHHLVTEWTDGSAWSGWAITDAEGFTWSGVLTLTANPLVEGEFFARVLVEEVIAVE